MDPQQLQTPRSVGSRSLFIKEIRIRGIAKFLNVYEDINGQGMCKTDLNEFELFFRPFSLKYKL
jgi:hypothetical protein